VQSENADVLSHVLFIQKSEQVPFLFWMHPFDVCFLFSTRSEREEFKKLYHTPFCILDNGTVQVSNGQCNFVLACPYT
jgi:hypothetical protein